MRSDTNLHVRYAAILSYAGMVFVIGGVIIVTPLLALLAWPGEYIHSTGFIFPAGTMGGLGALMWWLFRPSRPVSLTIQEGGTIVFLTWVAICLFSAWPFMAIMRFTFTQAVFESVSGWSGTGLTVSDVTVTPHVVLLWRSITQYAGGAGLAIIMLATIAGPVGVGLPAAEGRTDQLAPHVRDSARIVLTLYAGYAVFGIIALRVAGMTSFEAINHAFTALGTGGYSTRPDSIAGFNSFPIEFFCVVLMLLGNTNFLTAYLLLQGKVKTFFHNCEVRTAFVMVALFGFILFAIACRDLYPAWTKTLRVAFFEPISALTGTGLQTTTYHNWNGLGLLALIIPMIVGGGTGSTSGAIKQYRAYLMFYSVLWELRRPLLPKKAVVENYVWYGTGKVFMNDTRIREAADYVLLYLITLALGTAIIAAHGHEVGKALFEYASAQGTVGLSVGITQPNAPLPVLWTLIAGMFLGRLEFYVIFRSVAKIALDGRRMLFARG